jgi:hypothetical protein
MGWAVGFDPKWKRDIGYGVPATCDHPGCGAEIHRGLAYVCGGEPWGGDDGCGLFFCSEHMRHGNDVPQCERCLNGVDPFAPTPDVAEWNRHKLTDPSWQAWRDENADEVERLRSLMEQIAT